MFMRVMRLLRWMTLFLWVIFNAVGAPAMAAPPLMETLRGERPVRLQSLEIHGALSGGMAETRVRMVFFNPNGRALEGNLQFPLADGQQITGFALDIDGAMRPAVPVEKSRGRQIIEAEERRGVDPALLEQTQGNQFRLRVYPIPAQGTRTVELTYAEPLARDGAAWTYRLPLAYAADVKDFQLDLDVQGAAGMPRVTGLAEPVEFRGSDGKWGTRAVPGGAAGAANEANSPNAADAHAGGNVAPGWAAGGAALAPNGGWQAHIARPAPLITVQVPAAQHAQAYTERFGNDTYFVAEVPVDTQRAPRALPRSVGVLWDASGSGARRAVADELALLDRYFRALGNADVKLVLLRDRPEGAQAFRIRDGNWDALRKVLQAVQYDGASALADWQPQLDVQEYLLVSDGLINYGVRRFPTLAAGQRLYAVNSSAGADTVRLAALAERSGGALVSLTPGEPVDDAARLLLTDGPRITQLRADGATDVLADGAGVGQGVLRIAGKLTRPAAQIAFSLVRQGKAVPMAVQVDADAATHPLAAWLWAGYQLRELDADHEAHLGAIRRLGAQFGMPTRETSLLVLERLEDYVRHDVTPPPAMQAAYDKLRAQQGRMLALRRDKQLDSVVRQFEQKIAWWEHPAPQKNKRFKSDDDARLEPQSSLMLHLRDGPRPPDALRFAAPPAPAPAPVVAPAMPAGIASAKAAGMESARAASDTLARSRQQAESMQKARAESDAPAAIGIAVKKWAPNAPYIARMKAAAPDALYAIYLDEKPSWENSSAFYIDVADMLLARGKRDLALRVLSNLAEMDLENRQVLRVLGYRLLQAGAPQLAVPVFEQVKQLAEEEPQSFRDLALAYAAAERRQEAVDHLYEVVLRPWDGRFAEVELIALAEMNAIIATAPFGTRLDTSRIDSRLLRNLPLDMRAVLTWDADNSDMDLWVVDPDGEKCFYGNQNTLLGGRLSRDFTGGYGPEEFSMRRAKPGKYRVYANYFGDRQQLVTGATTLQLKLTTGFGTARAKDEMVTLRLKNGGSTVLVGEFEVK